MMMRRIWGPVIVSLMQKGVRQQKKTGVQNLTIGYTIYQVA